METHATEIEYKLEKICRVFFLNLNIHYTKIHVSYAECSTRIPSKITVKIQLVSTYEKGSYQVSVFLIELLTESEENTSIHFRALSTSNLVINTHTHNF